jgi:hypothetical protein
MSFLSPSNASKLQEDDYDDNCGLLIAGHTLVNQQRVRYAT